MLEQDSLAIKSISSNIMSTHNSDRTFLFNNFAIITEKEESDLNMKLIISIDIL